MLTQVLWLLTWPVLIIISYQLSRIALKKFERRVNTDNSSEE